MAGNPLPLTRLIEGFSQLQGIGSKTAVKLAYQVVAMPKEQAKAFGNAILEAHDKISNCTVCQNFTDREVCDICGDVRRDTSMICVVESPKDVAAFERTKEYSGLYHILHGLISPLDGIGPDQIYVKQLLQRLNNNEVKEVIMATNPTVEGEATAMYISKLIKPLGIKTTRLGFGIPVGAELEYADDMTLFSALQNRNEF